MIPVRFDEGDETSTGVTEITQCLANNDIEHRPGFGGWQQEFRASGACVGFT